MPFCQLFGFSHWSALPALRSAVLRRDAVYAVVYNVIPTSLPCTLLEFIHVSYIYIFLT